MPRPAGPDEPLADGPAADRTDTWVDVDMWSTTATLVVADPDVLAAALAELEKSLPM